MNDVYQIDGQKLSLHPQRVAQWMDAGDDLDKLIDIPPIYVEISPVGQCNHRCQFCSVDYIGYQRRQLDPLKAMRATDDMATMGVKSIMYAGEGEPLLHGGISGIIRAAKNVGLDVAITTNATNLNQNIIESLDCVTWLKASINGGDRETYAKVHRTKESDFDRVIANLGEAVQIRKEKGWTCTIGAQMVLLPDNFWSAQALVETCRDIGLDYVVLKPYSQNPHSTDTAERGFDKFNPLQIRDFHEFNTNKFKVIYRRATMEGLRVDRQYETCHSTPFFWAYIMATGDVYGCSAHLLDERFRFGNINEQSFTDIWHSNKRRSCIEMMRSFDLSVCRKNCRMEHSNQHLWRLKNPQMHDNFI